MNRDSSVVAPQGFLVALSVLCIGVGGCVTSPVGGSSGRDAPHASPVVAEHRKSITTTPLVVRVSDPAQLSSVANILILPPSLTNSKEVSAGALSAVSNSVEQIAERELSLTVFGKRWIGEVQDRSRLVAALDRSPQLSGLNSVGVDAVLRTELSSFVERRGSAVGGDPAAVSFVMTLVRTSDSRELWQGSYSYGQTYLSDNLLQLGDALGSKRRGAGWSSGREIFEVGATSALQDLNARRERQFLGSGS